MVDDNHKNQLPGNVNSENNNEKSNISNELTDTTEKKIKKTSEKKDVSSTDEQTSIPEGYLPAADNETESQADMPIALLEFTSPTAAIINMPPTASAQYITWVIGALALFSIIALCVFPLDKVVSAQGRLVSVDPPLLIQPMEESIIKSIDVKEGDFVTKGQVLAHLDPTIQQADIDNLRLQVESGQAEFDRLQAEASNKNYTVDPSNPYSVEQGNSFIKRKLEYDAKVDGFNQKINEQSFQLKNFLATTAVLKGRLQVASDIHLMRKKLQEQQVGSRLSTLGSQDTLMDVEDKLITAQQSANATQKKIASLLADKQAYIESWKGEVYKNLTLIQRQLAKDKGEYEKAKLRRKKVLMRAEQDAIVLSISKGSVGSILNSGMPFMTLVPVGTGLEVEAAVQDADVGYMKLGDKAIIKFDTFPYTQYGGAEAVVTNVSADVFQPGDTGQDMSNRRGAAPLQFREKPFYRVRLKINKYTLHSIPNFFHPTPGLTVTADVHVGKRTAAQYLMNGIVPKLTEGMRDPQ